MISSRIASIAYTAAVLGLATLTLAHPHGHDDTSSTDMGAMDMAVTSPPAPVTSEAVQFEPSYFRYGEYQLWIYGHIATMIISWVFVLPIGMLSEISNSLMNKADRDQPSCSPLRSRDTLFRPRQSF
jgi:Domain of unknown function (DUF2427)